MTAQAMTNNFALEAWNYAMAKGSNYMIRSVLTKLASEVEVDWDRVNPNEQELITFRFEDKSTLLVVEDTKGMYRFREIIEPEHRIVDEEMTDRFLVKVEKYRTRDWMSRNRGWWVLFGFFLYLLGGYVLIFA